MKYLPAMNLTLLETMISPLPLSQQDRREELLKQQLPSQEERSYRQNPASEYDDRLPPFRPLAVQSESSVPSKSIPITNMKRTLSEIQLCEEEALADYRDYCFYCRLVNGINSRREGNHDPYHRHRPTDPSVENIMRTRHLPVADGSFVHSTEAHSCASSYTNFTNVATRSGGIRHHSFLQGTKIVEEEQEDIFMLDL